MSNTALVRTMLRNDLRLFWRATATRPAVFAFTLLTRIGVFLLLHGMALALLHGYTEVAPRGGAELACLCVALLVAMTAVHRSIEVLYARGDLQLLLASPVPPRLVLMTRLFDIALTSLLGTVLMAVPFVDVAALLFGPRWLCGLPTWLATTLLLTPLAVAATVGAVGLLGIRRARLFVQLLGVGIGLLGIGAAQLPQLLSLRAAYGDRPSTPAATAAAVFAWFDVPPLRQLAAAAGGEWQRLPPLLLLAAAIWMLAFALLTRRFLHSAQGAMADQGGETTGGGDAAAAWRRAFARGPLAVQVRTQILLLRRDPLLLMRCALQIVSLVPMLFGALMLDRGAGMGGVGLMAAAIVPLTLAALLNANDDGRDLVAASPARPRHHAFARAIAAAMVPAAFAWAMAIAAAALAAPWCAPLVAVGGTWNALASGWLGTCTTRIHTAEDRARNRQPRVTWQTLYGMFAAGLGTAGIGLLDHGETLAGVLLFAGDLAIAGSMFRFRPQPFSA